MKRRLLILCVSLLLVAGVYLTSTSALAFAAVSPTHTTSHITEQQIQHVTKITVHMRVIGTKGKVSPQGVTELDCGAITLWIYNLRNGNAEFEEEVSSSKGIIISLSYSLNWTNWSFTGVGGSFGRPYAFPSNPWVHQDVAHTQAGYVTASLSATDVVGWGTVCSGVESDVRIIT